MYKESKSKLLRNNIRFSLSKQDNTSLINRQDNTSLINRQGTDLDLFELKV